MRTNLVLSSMLELEQLKSPHIIESRDANFAEIVLKNSAIGPVLVNYWSPKAGPCLRLYPILDKLTRKAAGKFLLVNVNVESERQAASDHGFASVPTLKLFRNGQVVETRHSDQDETSLQQRIARHVARPSDAAQGLRLLAEAALEDPGNTRLTVTFAKLLVRQGRHDEAYRLVYGLPEDTRTELSNLYVHLSLIRVGAEAPDRAALQAALEQVPEDDDARFKLAAPFVLSDKYASALAESLSRKGIARMATRALFKLLGPEHPLSVKYQAELSRFAH